MVVIKNLCFTAMLGAFLIFLQLAICDNDFTYVDTVHILTAKHTKWGF